METMMSDWSGLSRKAVENGSRLQIFNRRQFRICMRVAGPPLM
jgi:hypothetical protein